MSDHDHLIEVREAADLLGELLQEAGNRAGDVPLEGLRRKCLEALEPTSGLEPLTC